MEVAMHGVLSGRTRKAALYGGIAGGLALALLATAPVATAAPQCSFGGSSGPERGVLTVTLTAPGDSATLRPLEGQVVLNGAPCALAGVSGEVATAATTELVRVRDISGGPTELRLVEPSGLVASLDGAGSNRPAFDIDLGPGPGDLLRVESGPTPVRDFFRFGNWGGFTAADLNGRPAIEPGLDLGAAGVEQVVLDGAARDDHLDAGGGGAGFAGPLEAPVELFGFAGEDHLAGGAARDLLHGGAEMDSLSGGGARDVLLGEADDDVLSGGAGPDRVDGGAGSDLAEFNDVADDSRGLTADLGSGRTSGAGGGDRLISIEGITGTPFDDRMRGDAARNFLDGRAGDDRLAGGRGLDVLLGGPGRDRLRGGGARDIMLGGQGADRLRGQGGKDVLLGGPGPDRLRGGSGVDILDARNGGRDFLDCGRGRDGYDADRRDVVRNCEVRLRIGD